MDQCPQVDRGWLDLRQRHKSECDALAKAREASKREFQLETDRKLAALLTRHAQEEEGYWSSRSQKALPKRTSPEPMTPQLGAQAAQPKPIDRRATVSSLIELFDEQKHNSRPDALMTQQQASQLLEQPLLNPRTQQVRPSNPATSPTDVQLLSKPEQAARATAGSLAKSVSKKDPKYIDLCSSDDDDVIVEIPRTAFEQRAGLKSSPVKHCPTILSANMELFGTKPSHPTSPVLKQEQSMSLSESQHHLQMQSCNMNAQSPRESEKLADNGGTSPVIKADTLRQLGQQTSNLTTPTSHSELVEHPGVGSDYRNRNQDSDGDSSLEDLPLASFDTPAAMKKLGPLSAKQEDAIPGPVIELLALRAKTDPELKVVMKIAAADRASQRQLAFLQRHVKELTEKLEKENEEVKAPIPLPSVQTKQQAAEVSTSRFTERPTNIGDIQSSHVSSALPSSASSPAVIDEATSLLSPFEKPIQPSALGRSPTTANSRASSNTLAPSSATDDRQPVHQRASVASRNSSASTLCTNGKRRAINLSDDEESDYSPSDVSAVTARKGPGDFLGSPIKESKTSASSQAKPRVHPRPRPPYSPAGKKTGAMSSQVAPTTPATPPRISSTRPKYSTPITPMLYSGNVKVRPLLTPPSKRRAAIRAQSEIQKISEADEQFHTEDEIHRASAKEARRKDRGSPGLGARLRSMSITPVPMGTHFASSNPGRSDGRGAEGRIAAQRMAQAVGDDSDEDLDISEFTFVNGIIIQSGQERRLTEAQTKSDKQTFRME